MAGDGGKIGSGCSPASPGAPRLTFERLDAIGGFPETPAHVDPPGQAPAEAPFPTTTAAPKPPLQAPVAQKPARPAPSVASIKIIADSGVSLAVSVAKSHLHSYADVERLCRDYIAYTSTKPALRSLHDAAVAATPGILAERRAQENAKVYEAYAEALAELERRTAELEQEAKREEEQRGMASTQALMQVRPPVPVQKNVAVGAVVIPVADVVGKLTPGLGQILAAGEVVTGRSAMGLGDELSENERALALVLLVLPAVGGLVKGGARGAALVIEIAARSNRSTATVLRTFERMLKLAPERAVLQNALQKAARGEALTLAEQQAHRRAMNVLDDIRGTAQDTRFRGIDTSKVAGHPDKVTYGAWAPNAAGAVRSVDDAVALLRAQGVEVPSWVRIVKVPAMADKSAVITEGGAVSMGTARSGTVMAEYPLSRAAHQKALSGQKLSFDDILEEDGKLLIRVREDVFESDEALVGVLSHEIHEVTSLRRAFDEVDLMSAADLRRWVHPGRGQNLHGQAWDVADLRVLLMRAQTPAERAAIQARLDALLNRFEDMNFSGQ